MFMTPRLTIAMIYAVGALGLVASFGCEVVAHAAGVG